MDKVKTKLACLYLKALFSRYIVLHSYVLSSTEALRVRCRVLPLSMVVNFAYMYSVYVTKDVLRLLFQLRMSFCLAVRPSSKFEVDSIV